MFGHGIPVSELFKHPIMEKCSLLAGIAGVDKRVVSRVSVMDAPDVVDWMRGEELLLTTGYVMRDNPILIKELIIALDKKKVAGLGIKLGRFINKLPDAVLDTADELEFPLFCIPMGYAFSDMFNPVLNMIIKEHQNTLIVQSSQLKFQDYVSRSFLEMMVSGEDARALLLHLKSLINNDVVFFDARNQSWYSTNTQSEFFSRMCNLDKKTIYEIYHFCPIEMDGERYGDIIIDCPKQTEMPNNWIWSINYAKIALLLFIQKRISIREVRLRYKDAFLQSLLFHPTNHDNYTEEQRDLLGSSFLPPYVVLIVDIDNVESYPKKIGSISSSNPLHVFREGLWADIFHYLKMHFGRVHYTTVAGKQVSLVSLHPDPTEKLARIQEVLMRYKKEMAKNEDARSISIAIGGIVEELSAIPASYKQAKTCIDFARSSNIQDVFLVWERMGLLRLLTTSNKQEINNFVNQYLGNFCQLKPSVTAQYLETLNVLANNGWNYKSSAKELHVHYNTLRYRMQRIVEIASFNIEDPENRAELLLALKLYNINKNLSLF